MPNDIFAFSVPVFMRGHAILADLLRKAETHAAERKIVPSVLLTARLFPDMFPLERQVRQVCTHSCGAGRVAGLSLPSFPDQDNSFAEMQARIDKTVDFLKGLRADQLDGKEDTVITVPVGGQPREFKCQNYLYHFAMLQVQFHATTAYDILRSTGASIGKRDYLGPMPS